MAVQRLDPMSTSALALKQALDELSHLDLTRDIAKNGSTQVGGGGFSDVFHSKMRKGWQPRPDTHIQNLLDLDKSSNSAAISVTRLQFWKKSNHVMVAVKRLRFWDRPIPKVEKTIAKELKIWAKLSHPNVLPILGYVLNWTGSAYPSLVSPWMENGTLRDYMKRTGVDLHIVVMAAGIASGLQYLHSQQVIHADLKCDNILLSPTLQPLLTDFGLSRQVIASISTSTTTFGGSLRWKSPELLSEGGGKANEHSDVWAFGMTLLELLTKDVPYSGLMDSQVMRSLIDGILPSAPSNMAERPVVDQHVWYLCEDCWTVDPSERPSVIKVKSMLSQMIPPELITQLSQILDIYPHLNLASVVNSFFFFPLSPSALASYLQSRQNITLQNLLAELNFAQLWNPESLGFTRVTLKYQSAHFNSKAQIVARELATLAELSHPNVLPLLGYTFASDEQLAFVFPKTRINLNLFNSTPGNTVKILPTAEGIASGIAYLHSRGVVCSTITSLNIMLSPTLQPLIELTELWLSRPDTGLPQTIYQEIYALYCRWMAVEIFDNRLECIECTSRETDIWAFGMTVLELFTKDEPFGSSTSPSAVIQNLKRHQLPSPPDGIHRRSMAEQELFALCQECWNFEPSKRPTAQQIHERIQKFKRDISSDSISQ